jgi:hypothetical protein
LDEVTKRKIEILESALGEYMKKQKVDDTRCEQCNEVIKIEKISDSVISVKCKCGYHNDTLRGL